MKTQISGWLVGRDCSVGDGIRCVAQPLKTTYRAAGMYPRLSIRWPLCLRSERHRHAKQRRSPARSRQTVSSGWEGRTINAGGDDLVFAGEGEDTVTVAAKATTRSTPATAKDASRADRAMIPSTATTAMISCAEVTATTPSGGPAKIAYWRCRQ